MIRRGILGAIMGSPLLAGRVSAMPARLVGGGAWVAPPPDSISGLAEGGKPSTSRALHEKLRALSRPVERAYRRRRRAQDLLGGLPPHLASMRSCAPWFLAQRAALWEEEQEDRSSTLLGKFYESVFGENING